jgi:hypothetical protein
MASTAASKKLSIRRKIASTHKIPKRIGGAKSNKVKVKSELVDLPAKIESQQKCHVVRKPSKKIKVKRESDDDDITYQPPTASTRKIVKRPKKSDVAVAKKTKVKGRTTYNSLSTTIDPTIHKRKYQRKSFASTGRICSSYYPSNRKVRPNDAGDRYFKGKPYLFLLATSLIFSGKCAREDCMGDSKATVTRHCISEYLQKGARGSSIPRHLRLHWCNKCYMRYSSHPFHDLLWL